MRRTLSLLGLGVLTSLIFGCQGGDESPTAPPPPSSVINRENVTEAIFLGTGPLAAGGACGGGTNWQAYPRGSRLRLIVSTTVSAEQLATITTVASEIPALTNGWLGIEITSTSDPNPRPQSLEVTSTNVSQAEIDSSCRPGAGGCVLYGFRAPWTLNAARMLNLNRFNGSGHAHELGHALLGLCHVDGNAVPGSLMGNPHASTTDRLSPLERQAIQAVYRAGLSPGATREEFARAGLVAPLASAVSRSTSGLNSGASIEDSQHERDARGRVLPSRGSAEGAEGRADRPLMRPSSSPSRKPPR
jgi:hypothetical protein